MNIEIFNQQDRLKIYPDLIPIIVKQVLDEEKIYCDEVSITFVDKQEISRLHLQFFNDPSPTDCITLPIDDPNEETPYLVLGEIFVSTDAAIEYAEENGVSPYNELALYVIHGLLHLIGYNDLEEQEEKAMREAEKKHLDLLKAKGIEFDL